MSTSKAYDDDVEKFRKAIRGNKVSTVLEPEAAQKEIEAIVPDYIGTSGPELDAIAHTLETGDIIAPVVKVTRSELEKQFEQPKRKRGRPLGSRNKPKQEIK